MTNYGPNFGFRRSGGDSATREGKYLVPAEVQLRQGQVVEIDKAKPGYVKLAPADTVLRAGWSGLLIQEEGWNGDVFEAPQHDTHDMGFIRPNMRCAIWTGAGLLIWVKNTEALDRPGRTIPARTMLAAGLAVGDDVAWDGSKFVKATADNVIGRVSKVAGAVGTEYAEIVLS